MDNNNEKRPVVEYPCRWLYKVIGRDSKEICRAVAGLLKDEKYSLSPSNTSSTGKYSSLNLEVLVKDEETRNAIYLSLKNHPEIMMVL